MKYAYKGKEIRPSVDISHEIIPYIADIPEHVFYMDAEKCAYAWKTANAVLQDFFGDYRKVNAPYAAPLSYGHLISIGAPYTLPENSEPNVKPFAHDIDEAIAIMKDVQGIDFGDNDLCRHYLAVNKYLQEQFPEYNIAPLAGYGGEGIITTAELMRGQDIFIDLYEEPEKVHEYFKLLNKSIIDFYCWMNRINGVPEISTYGAGLADDFAALIPPYLWEEFVVPYWNEYYEARTTGNGRNLHCEDLSPEHLKYLSDVKITHYQPSVSDKLTLENVKANTDIPFDWLLYAWKVTEMSDEEIQNWVDTAAEAGVTTIRTQIGKYAWMNNRQDRILAFYKAFDKYRVE